MGGILLTPGGSTLSLINILAGMFLIISYRFLAPV